MMEKTDETIPSREELAVFIEEAESQKQEDFQRFGHCRISIEWPHCSSLPFHVPREQEEDSVYRHGAGTPSLSTGTEAHPAFGGNAG